MKQTIMGNKMWVYGFNVKTKIQSPQWGRKRFSKAKKDLGEIKCENRV